MDFIHCVFTEAPCCMRSAGLVSVPICGGGPVHSVDRPPRPSNRQALALCPRLQRETKPSPACHVMVSLPTDVSAIVGQWLIFVHLAKCLQDVCLGCLFPPLPPPPACLGVAGLEWQAHAPSSSSHATPHPRLAVSASPSFQRRGQLILIMETQRATWPDNDLLFWPQPLFDPPLAVCWVYAGGAWWEKAWPSMEELQHFTVSVAD